MKTYPVHYMEKPSGEIELSINGLYCNYKCRCHLNKNGIYRVNGHFSGKKINLGVCCPENGIWTVSGKFPKNLLGDGEPYFTVTGDADRLKFYAVNSKLPFENLDLLAYGRYCTENGVVGISVPESHSALSDSSNI